jgi:Protein of unknown function (DUF3800)
MGSELHLYFDDTGSRNPDHEPRERRKDGMDCFGFGGILINEEDIDALIAAYRAFRESWRIDYPFHSHEIRGGRGSFGWLKKPENAVEFLPALEDLLLSLPVIGIAAVVHRPGYVERHRDLYQDRMGMMSKTAYSVLIERAAKFARSRGRKLRVFFEGAGAAEDNDIIAYAKALKEDGMPFDQQNSAAHRALTAADFRSIVLGEPRRKTKATPMMQIADLVLYPMAKGGYDPSYRPYAKLMAQKKLIDAVIDPEERPMLGIKYSCFPNDKGPAKPGL